MDQPPQFLQTKWSIEEVEGRYQPLNTGRQGELLAWLSAAGAALGTALLLWRGAGSSSLGVGATLVFSLMAALISFGNWVDRNTMIDVRIDSIAYSSPLRKQEFVWDQIREMILTPSNRGWRIQVIGEKSSFHYLSGGNLSFGKREEMAIGIPGGTDVAGFIRSRCDLNAIEQRGEDWVCRHSKK